MRIAVIPGTVLARTSLLKRSRCRDILLGTRFEFDLDVNYRPVRLLDDRLCPLKDRGRKDINFVVFRENTEGVYVSIGGRFKAGTTDEVAASNWHIRPEAARPRPASAAARALR